MARQARQTMINTGPLPEQVEAAITADLQAADQLPVIEAQISGNAQALAVELAYDGALTVESLEEEIKFYQRRSVEAVLETGKRLLLLKEVAGHGAFGASLSSLGIGYELAKKLMAATKKFQIGSRLPLLALPNLNQGKLLELLVLDDGEIEALNNGDSIRGVTLDDVDCMSVSELRRALRQEKAEREAEVTKAKAAVSGELAAKDRMIADKSKRIAELVEEKNQRERMTEGERAESLEQALTGHMLTAAGALIPVRNTIHAIRSEFEHVPNGLYVAMQAALHRVLSEAESIANDYGISLDFGLPTFSGADPLADLDDPNAGETFGQEIEPV